MAEHTPGPWHISGSVDRALSEANLHIGAKGSPMVLASMNEVHVDTEANARLIAAAPDLLSACVAHLAAREALDIPGAPYWSEAKFDPALKAVEDTLADMRAAIAKATGQ